MLVQQIISGGREMYSGTVTLMFLKNVFNHSLPFKEKMFPPLESEEKAIDEMARLIVHRIIRGEDWWMGGFSFAIYPLPSFQPLTLVHDEKESPGIWGQLHLGREGSEVWFPLDGYQRMLAMFRALSMLPGQKRRVIEENMIPVLLLPFSQLTDCYEILLRMHKSSRSIDRGKAIRTTVNDDYAVYARRLMGEEKPYPEIIKRDLINWQSNTLTNRLEKFSTLSVLYDSAKMLDQAFAQTSDKEQRYLEIASIWTLLLERFTLFRESMGTPRDLPKLRSRFLCLKPTGQLIIIAVIALALRTQKELSLEEVIERLNEVRWEIDQPHWQNVVVMDGRITGTGSAINLTSRLVGYLIGISLSDVEVQLLEADYRKATRDKNTTLPKPLFPKKDK